MSQPQRQLRAFLDDGPHSGQTISVEPDADGRPPPRIVVHVPSEGLQVRQRPSSHDAAEGSATDGAAIIYQLTGADENLGLWVYRTAEG